MKRKITAVLLCVTLSFALSFNALAGVTIDVTQDSQTIPVLNEKTINTDENYDIDAFKVRTHIDDNISLTSTAVAPIGHLDTVNSSIIGGWAYQSDIPNTALTVHIYIINNSTGQQRIIPVTANGYRADLAAAGYGNGYHAFQYNVSWKTYKPGTYTVRAYAISPNNSNPQLNNSPKTFTVRNMAGVIDEISSTKIKGWAWKPDAPNESVGVHAHIIQGSTVLEIKTAQANIYRQDLQNGGYGNGYHGFSIPIDWTQYPEERLRIIVYMYDESGYSPVLYDGYYDNRMPIYLIGMTDAYGVDFSSWATQEVVNYAYNIGTPSVIICHGANKLGLVDVIRKSSYATVYTHGSPESIDYRIYPNTSNEQKGSLNVEDILELDDNYFKDTRCLLLNSCSTANDEGNNGNNVANAFYNRGVRTVVAFKKYTYFWKLGDGVSIDTSLGNALWAKVFTRELGTGATVITAANTAFEEMYQAQLDAFNITENQLEILIEENPTFVEENIYCGMDLSSRVILGDGNQIVRH